MSDSTSEPGDEETRTSPEAEASKPESSEPPVKGVARDPARVATLVVLALCVAFFLLYLRADRVMPYSDQARVSGYRVSMVPQVSGLSPASRWPSTSR